MEDMKTWREGGGKVVGSGKQCLGICLTFIYLFVFISSCICICVLCHAFKMRVTWYTPWYYVRVVDDSYITYGIEQPLPAVLHMEYMTYTYGDVVY